MENKNLLDEDMQQIFEYYLKNDSYKRCHRWLKKT